VRLYAEEEPDVAAHRFLITVEVADEKVELARYIHSAIMRNFPAKLKDSTCAGAIFPGFSVTIRRFLRQF
jgi:hypothetical protein